MRAVGGSVANERDNDPRRASEEHGREVVDPNVGVWPLAYLAWRGFALTSASFA